MTLDFIKDPRWLELDQTTQDKMIDASFKESIETDPRWSELDSQAQSEMRRAYFQEADGLAQSSHAVDERGLGGDVVSHLVRGAAQLGELTGYGLKTLDPDGGASLGDKIGQKMIDLSQGAKKYDIFRPDESEVTGEGFVKRGVMGGLESSVSSVVPALTGAGTGAKIGGLLFGPAGVIPGAFVGGTAATIATFGFGTYGQKAEELKRAGIPEEQAHKAALKNAVIEAGGEEVSNILGALTFGFGKFATQPLKTTAKELLRTPMKEFAKKFAKNTMLNELPTELVQATLQSKIDENLGLLPEGAWQEAAVETIIPTLTMSVLFSVGAQGMASARNNQIKKQLNSENLTERASAVEFIANRIEDKELQNAWIGMASSAIAEKKPIVITADFSQYKAPEKDIKETPVQIAQAKDVDEAVGIFSQNIDKALEDKSWEEEKQGLLMQRGVADFQKGLRSIEVTEDEDGVPTYGDVIPFGPMVDRVKIAQAQRQNEIEGIASQPTRFNEGQAQIDQNVKDFRENIDQVRFQEGLTKQPDEPTAPMDNGLIYGDPYENPKVKPIVRPRVEVDTTQSYTDPEVKPIVMPRVPVQMPREEIETEVETPAKVETPVSVPEPVIEPVTPEKLVEDFNAKNPGKEIKFDSIYDRSKSNKGPLYQFTPIGDKYLGQTFALEELSEKALSEKVNALKPLSDEIVAKLRKKEKELAEKKVIGIKKKEEVKPEKVESIEETPTVESLTSESLPIEDTHTRYDIKFVKKGGKWYDPENNEVTNEKDIKALDEKKETKKEIKVRDVKAELEQAEVKKDDEPKFSTEEPERLITKPQRDFHSNMMQEIKDRASATADKVEAYQDWKYEVGDKVRSNKTGRVYTITGKGWNNQKNEPIYYTENYASDGDSIKQTQFAKKFEEIVTPVIDPKDRFKVITGEKFSTEEKPTGKGVSLADVQNIFKTQKVFVSDNGDISVRFKNKKGLTIKQVDEVSDDDIKVAISSGVMSEKGLIVGKAVNSEITLNKNFANEGTLFHETFHTLINLGIISEKDYQALKLEFYSLAQKGKLDFAKSTHKDQAKALEENLANTFSQIMVQRKKYRESFLGNLVQKVMDFFNGLWNIGRMSARKFAKEFETGKVFEREGKEESNQNDKTMFAVIHESYDDVFSVPEASTKLEDFEYNIIDLMSPFSKVYKQIKKAIPEDDDFILKERLRFNRSSEAIKNANETIFVPMKKVLAKYKLDFSHADEALYTRHAPEANERLKRTNAKRYLTDLAKLKKDKELDKKIKVLEKAFRKAEIPTKELQEGFLKLLEEEIQNVDGKRQEEIRDEWLEKSKKFSGMTTEEAEMLYNLKWKNNFGMQEVLKMHDDMVQKTREISYKSGRISKSEFEALSNTFEFYTPLYREGFAPKKGFEETGRGIINLKKDYKIRGGSTKKAVNMLGNAMIQHEHALLKAEKARSAMALMNLIKHNPNPDFWMIEQKPLINKYDHQGNIVKSEDTSIAPNEVPIKVDGKFYTVWFNPQNEHAQRIIDHLKGNNENAGAIVNGMAKFNRILSMINTSLNPEFLLTNLPRDLQIAFINLNSTDLFKMKGQVIKDVPKAIMGLRDHFRGEGKSEWAKWVKEYSEAGGMMDWVDFTKDVESKVKGFEKDIKRYQGKRIPEEIGLKIIKFISDYNSIAENAVRLSAFVNARKVGISQDKAALLSKELTVNFGQKGKYGYLINSLYLFSNAGIQGSARLIGGLAKSKQAQKLMAGFVVTAIGVAIANGLMAGDDDDGTNHYDNVKDYEKERNIIIMIPGTGDALKLPLGWGLNFFWNVGTEIGDMILAGIGEKNGYDPMAGATRLTNIAFNAFNPIQSATLAQSISPTILDPVMQVAENKTFFGAPLMPEKNMFEKVETPDSQRYWSTVKPYTKWVAEMLNDVTGGDKVTKGKVDISPETMDLVLDTLTGGAGKFFGDFFGTLGNVVTGSEVEVKDIPMVRKVYTEPDLYRTSREFYDNAEHVQLVNSQIEAFPSEEMTFKIDRTYLLKNDLKRIDKRLKALRKKRDSIEDEDMKDYFDKEIKKIQGDFNKRFELRAS